MAQGLWQANGHTQRVLPVPSSRTPHSTACPQAHPQLSATRPSHSTGQAQPCARLPPLQVATVAAPPASVSNCEPWLPTDGEEAPPTCLQTDGRIVAIGDIHGDLSKAVTCLELAGVLTQVNERPVWCGGNTIVVQLGDVLDRGDQEIGTLLLLQELARQAKEQGGAVIMLNGNHECMNLIGNFRFATLGGMREAAAAAGIRGEALGNPAALAQGRRRLYQPGGPIAQMLSQNPTLLKINDTLFAHGGVLPQHISFGMERMNFEVSRWMKGDIATSAKEDAQMLAMGNSRSVMWNRMFGADSFRAKGSSYIRSTLHQVLDQTECSQLVIGHSVQTCGANVQCDGRLWRLDVGMSCGVLNAAPQVLEIFKDGAGRTVNRLLTAVPVAKDVAPLGVPYCRMGW